MVRGCVPMRATMESTGLVAEDSSRRGKRQCAAVKMAVGDMRVPPHL